MVVAEPAASLSPHPRESLRGKYIEQLPKKKEQRLNYVQNYVQLCFTNFIQSCYFCYCLATLVQQSWQ